MMFTHVVLFHVSRGGWVKKGQRGQANAHIRVVSPCTADKRYRPAKTLQDSKPQMLLQEASQASVVIVNPGRFMGRDVPRKKAA